MKLVTTILKSGGLNEKHVVATWKVGKHQIHVGVHVTELESINRGEKMLGGRRSGRPCPKMESKCHGGKKEEGKWKKLIM
jgi:hypothetical protein